MNYQYDSSPPRIWHGYEATKLCSEELCHKTVFGPVSFQPMLGTANANYKLFLAAGTRLLVV